MIDRRRTGTVSQWLLTACGAWLRALGLYFIVLRSPLLPEDLRFMGATLAQLREAAPGLERWLRIVFAVMGGYMAGVGALTLFFARRVMLLRLKGTAWVLALAGLSAVVLMSAMSFVLHSDFRWVLLMPAICWVAGVIAYVLPD